MPLLKAAYLWICPGCKIHANFVCSDGSKSSMFATKKGGQVRLFELAEQGRVDRFELQHLQQELQKAPLIARSDEIDVMVQAFEEEAKALEECTDSGEDDPDFRVSARKMRDLFMGRHSANKPDKSKLN